MVAPMNRSGKTDAVQIGGNDNHPEKMGNRVAHDHWPRLITLSFPKGLPPSMGAPLAPGATAHPSFSKIEAARQSEPAFTDSGHRCT